MTGALLQKISNAYIKRNNVQLMFFLFGTRISDKSGSNPEKSTEKELKINLC